MFSRAVLIGVVIKCCFGQLDVHDSCSSSGQEGVCKFVIQCKVAIENIRSSGAHKLKRCGFLGLSEIVCCLESGFGDRLNPDSSGGEQNVTSPDFAEMTLEHSISPAAAPTTSRTTVAGRPTGPPPAPQARPPPEARPPAPQTRPHAPQTRPPMPQTRPPMPQTRPPVPSTATEAGTTTKKPPISLIVAGFDDGSKQINTNLRIADQECQKILKSVPPPLDLFILGGNNAAPGEFPHSVVIGYENNPPKEEDKGLEFLCGGSLISEYYVMSAAHCFRAAGLRNREPKLIRVGVNIGESKGYNPETDYNISKVIIHPDYNMKTLHDISLVRLQTAVPISDLTHPGCLYTRDEAPIGNLLVVGFGVVDIRDRKRTTMLQKASLSYYPTEECRELYKPFLTRRLVGITDEMLCAGDKEGRKDACQGDSGGPLQVLSEKDGQFRIIGITSFGMSCGTKVPGVYTRVAAYLDWIEDVVWSSSTDGRPLLAPPPSTTKREMPL